MRLRSILLVSILLATPFLLAPAHGESNRAVFACRPPCVFDHGCTSPECVLPPTCPEGADCAPNPSASRPMPGSGACSGSQARFSFLLYTGRGANGNGASKGAADSLWYLASYPGGAGPAVSAGVSPHPGVWVSDPASSWVNPYGVKLEGPGGQYLFEARYYVPPLAYGVTISGRYAADNSVVVSDTSQTQSTLLHTSPSNAFGSWTSLPTTSVEGPGVHTLSALVHNIPTSVGTDTKVGLNVQFLVHGYCKTRGPTLGAACTGAAKTFSINLATGIDAAGNPLPAGAPDPAWVTLNQPGPGSPPGPAYSHGANPSPTAWVRDPASAWINHNPASVFGPMGSYTYQVDYVLPTRAYDVAVTGRIATDNSATAFDMDVSQSTFVASTGVYGFASWTPFAYSVNVLGRHTFRVDVHNADGPTGINVQAIVSGKCRAAFPPIGPAEPVVEDMA